MPLLTTGLALATIPIFGTWLLTRFPDDPHKPTVYPSLASLPEDSEARQIYPEDFYPGGAYADMPYGKVGIRETRSDNLLTRSLGSILVVWARGGAQGALGASSLKSL